MRVVVLGAGLQAQAIVHDLVKSARIDEVVVGDVDLKNAQALARRWRSKKIRPVRIDATQLPAVKRLLKGAAVAIGATTYAHNLGLTRASLEAGCHFLDLGGNVDVVREQHKLSAAAKKAGVTVIPDCGLAPGMANVLAYHWATELAAAESVKIRVGGLPQTPKTRLNYQLVFSVQGLINEYVEVCEILADGKKQLVPGMSGVERLRFGELGELEAFYTSGGTSTLPKTLGGTVRHLDYKTIRYPGHAQYIQFLMELGLLASAPVSLDKKTTVVPRQLTAKLLSDFLPKEGADLVLIRIEVAGRPVGRPGLVTARYDCLDRADPKSGLSAMQRTTGFPVAIIAQMLAAGEINERGTVPQELAVPGARFVQELARRGIVFSRTEV